MTAQYTLQRHHNPMPWVRRAYTLSSRACTLSSPLDTYHRPDFKNQHRVCRVLLARAKQGESPWIHESCMHAKPPSGRFQGSGFVLSQQALSPRLPMAFQLPHSLTFLNAPGVVDLLPSSPSQTNPAIRDRQTKHAAVCGYLPACTW